MNTKRHWDWNRIGWTIAIPVIVSGCSVIFIGIGFLELFWMMPENLGFVDYVLMWLGGAITVGILYILICYTIPAVFLFYYHNGDARKDNGEKKKKDNN